MKARAIALLLVALLAAPLVATGTAETAAGEQEVLRLSAWVHSQGWYRGNVTEDIVKQAIAEETGVWIDEVFTSGELSNFERFNLLFQSGELPDLALRDMAGQEFSDIMPTLESADLIHKFTDDELDRWIPDIRKTIPAATWELRRRPDGRHAYIIAATRHAGTWWQENYPEWAQGVNRTVSGNNFFFIRDDILNEIFPGSPTFAEHEEIYERTGTLSWDDIHVPQLDTYDGFIDFLYEVQDRFGDELIPYGSVGRHQLTDRWMRAFRGSTVYVQFNPVTMEPHALPYDDREGFIDLMRDLNRLYNDGIIDPDLAIHRNEQYVEKLHAGRYAVAIGFRTNIMNVNQALEEQGLPFRYVQVPVSYSTNDLVVDGYGQIEAVRNREGWVLFNSIDDADVPRVLDYFNYFVTQEGMQMIAWGPESSGLWEEVNGVRRWADEEFAAAVRGEAPAGVNGPEYYGILGANNRSHRDEFYQPMWQRGWPNPYYPTYEASEPHIQAAYGTATQDLVEGYFDYGHAAWNVTTASNDVFWQQWGPMHEELTKAIVSGSEAEFMSFIDSFYDVYYNDAEIENYMDEQITGYMTWLAENSDTLQFHPDADLSKLDAYR